MQEKLEKTFWKYFLLCQITHEYYIVFKLKCISFIWYVPIFYKRKAGGLNSMQFCHSSTSINILLDEISTSLAVLKEWNNGIISFFELHPHFTINQRFQEICVKHSKYSNYIRFEYKHKSGIVCIKTCL